ncbi:MAG: hypothetical protein JXA07_04095 [Spirochaetes bacterium]|nr:hypothetical protein [Spirochaetota bacterium]
MKNDLAKYNDISDRLHTGDMITFAGAGLVSWIIRVATKRSHIALVIRLKDYEGDEKRRFMLEAHGLHGISLHLLSGRLEEYSGKAWWLPLKDEFEPVRPFIGSWAFAQLGTHYDYPGLLLNALGRVSESSRAYFCSEFAWRAIRGGVKRAAMGGVSEASELMQAIWKDSSRINMKAPRPGDFLRFTNVFGKEVPIL